MITSDLKLNFLKDKYRKENQIKYAIAKKNKEKQKNFAINKAIIDKKINDKQIIFYREKMKEDIIYRIINSISSRCSNFLKEKNIDRKDEHLELLGCSPDELKIYLESKFTEGMTFENYGE